MNRWKVKQGNTSRQEFPVYDKKGVLIPNLSEASEIKFVVKRDVDSAEALITKTVDSGISVDTPLEGWLEIALLPSDTEAEVRRYVMGLQIIWSVEEKWETIMEIGGRESDIFEITKDVV